MNMRRPVVVIRHNQGRDRGRAVKAKGRRVGQGAILDATETDKNWPAATGAIREMGAFPP